MLAAPTRTSVAGGSQRGDRGGGPEKQEEDEVMETQSLLSLGVSERLCCSVLLLLWDGGMEARPHVRDEALHIYKDL